MKNQALEGILYGEKVARNGLIALIILGTLKAIAGFVTGAVVLLADAMATAADVVTLFGSYMGLKLSKRGAEGGFKYGYYKVETLIAFLISLSIIYLGIRVMIKNITRFYQPAEVQYPLIAIGMVVVAIAFSLHYAYELRIAAKKANSLSLLSNAKEKESDILTSFIILVAILASFYKLPYVEGFVGIGISLVILKVGFGSAKDSMFYLLDYWDDPKLLQKIENIIKKNAKIVTEIKKIRLRRAGTWIFGEVFLEVPSFADARDIRSELNRLQEKIRAANKYLKDFIIYFKIPKPLAIKVAIPVKDQNSLQSIVAINAEEAKYYLIVELEQEKSNLKTVQYLPVDLTNTAGINKIVEMLKKEKVQVVINNNLHSLLYYTLQHIHHIQLYPAFPNIKTVQDTLKLLLIDT